jgi:catechol 2,3-dioxygenase-like lactoylglutathione lyase family enzyme
MRHQGFSNRRLLPSRDAGTRRGMDEAMRRGLLSLSPGCERGQQQAREDVNSLPDRVTVSPRSCVSATRPRAALLTLGLLFALSFFPLPARAQLLPPKDARVAVSASRVPLRLTTVDRVVAAGMTVSDMDRSVDFYSRVLSFEKVSDVEVTGPDYERLQGVFGLRMRVVRMRLGEEFIELTEYLTPRGKPVPIDSRSNDRWFQHIAIITSDMDKAYAWLRQNKVEHASTAPQRLPDWNKNAAGIKAFYFRDPDRHFLEVLQFPDDKGDPKWHRPTDKLFLGIDHTAIVVSNTEASLKFYRDLLGLKIAGTSENYGTEQEHLNNVFGARLRITSLRAPAGGPGIEFLEYLAPRDGRPAPADERANDLAYWQTTLLVVAVDAVATQLANARYSFISPGVVNVTDGTLGIKKAALVRDPDGHAMLLLEK